MNSPAHWLSLYSAIMHLTMGLAGLFNIDLPPSWVQLYKLIPGSEWVYPGAYILTGVIAVVGIQQPSALRWACCMSAILFLIWGSLGIYSMLNGTGGNIQGSAANFYIAGAALVLSYYVSVGVKGNRIEQQISNIKEMVEEKLNTTLEEKVEEIESHK